MAFGFQCGNCHRHRDNEAKLIPKRKTVYFRIQIAEKSTTKLNALSRYPDTTCTSTYYSNNSVHVQHFFSIMSQRMFPSTWFCSSPFSGQILLLSCLSLLSKRGCLSQYIRSSAVKKWYTQILPSFNQLLHFSVASQSKDTPIGQSKASFQNFQISCHSHAPLADYLVLASPIETEIVL